LVSIARRQSQQDAHHSFPEILIQGVKKLEPEEIAKKIQTFDAELCTQRFLSEIKRVLPTPEQVLAIMQTSMPS
jgi:hypothetical protein